jgi:hypothetical protein
VAKITYRNLKMSGHDVLGSSSLRQKSTLIVKRRLVRTDNALVLYKYLYRKHPKQLYESMASKDSSA